MQGKNEKVNHLWQSETDWIIQRQCTSEEKQNRTYRAWKYQSQEYQMAKDQLLDQCFSNWVQTPELYEEFHAFENTDTL